MDISSGRKIGPSRNFETGVSDPFSEYLTSHNIAATIRIIFTF